MKINMCHLTFRTTYTSAVAPLLSLAMKLRNQSISDEEFASKTQETKEQIPKVMEAPSSHLGIRHIQNIFIEQEERLYHWADDRKCRAENNLSERDLRPTHRQTPQETSSSSDGDLRRSVQVFRRIREGKYLGRIPSPTAHPVSSDRTSTASPDINLRRVQSLFRHLGRIIPRPPTFETVQRFNRTDRKRAGGDHRQFTLLCWWRRRNVGYYDRS